jgi:hypothetical protein
MVTSLAGALPVAFRPDVFDGLANHLLELVLGNIGERFTSFAHRLMKDAPADGFFNEFREVALLHPPSPQKCALGKSVSLDKAIVRRVTSVSDVALLKGIYPFISIVAQETGQ